MLNLDLGFDLLFFSEKVNGGEIIYFSMFGNVDSEISRNAYSIVLSYPLQSLPFALNLC